MNIKKNWIYLPLPLIVIVIGVFFGLKYFAKPKSDSAQTAFVGPGPGSNNQADPGQNGRGGGFNRGIFEPLHGTVASIGSQTIVMTADDRSTKNVAVADSTRITKMDNGTREQLTLADINVGDEINVMTSDSSASDIQARMIVIGAFTPPSSGDDWRGGPGMDNPSGSDYNNNPSSSSSDTQAL